MENEAVHPISREAWISASVNKTPVIVKVTQDGGMTPVDLSAFTQAVHTLNNVAADGVKFWRDIPATTLAITDLDYDDGTLYVSGLSTGEFASTLRKVSYPFTGSNDTSHIEIYHTVHDQTETRAPVRAMDVLKLGVDIDNRKRLYIIWLRLDGVPASKQVFKLSLSSISAQALQRVLRRN